MSAATIARTRRPAARGVDRLTLVVGLALVDWSHARAARRALADRTPRRSRIQIDEARLQAARLEHDALGMTRFR
ncbi:hypothetical protein GCM10025867_22430 [Frondihabitans sucicola]|uniref:DUF1127 domain-containing protein n=1 Tax=Frondihabitans sucicola TaxID=1268041 RepID=A0ABN6XY89_9MICO|nr:hypothetical protein [Frondihabitans sucicola]BDZ50002.1 hypothetical protein GCM10025867_22430 [Frondihabitans sucicola]